MRHDDRSRVRSHMRVVVKTVLIKLELELRGWRASLFPSLANELDFS